MNWCIIIPILAAIIGAILGWLLRHLTCKCDDNESNDDSSLIDELKRKNTKLQADLDACLVAKSAATAKLSASTSASNSFTASAPEPVIAAVPFDTKLASGIIGKKVKQDDLKIVEGIGPKISELFNANGVSTWKELSETSVERCLEILKLGGKRFEIHNPGTWPKQSGLAYNGKWKELKELQDYLDGGVDRG